jgi:hypothetical protein
MGEQVSMPKAYDPRPHPGTCADHRGRLRRRWAVPFHWLEWLSRMSAYYLSHWSFLEVLEYAGRFTVHGANLESANLSAIFATATCAGPTLSTRTSVMPISPALILAAQS